jgi:hypothetical protein
MICERRRFVDEVVGELAERERAKFIAGYIAALRDIERTGLQPLTDKTMRESAHRAWRDQGGG